MLAQTEPQSRPLNKPGEGAVSLANESRDLSTLDWIICDKGAYDLDRKRLRIAGSLLDNRPFESSRSTVRVLRGA